MIREEEVYHIGQTVKTHGIHGELVMSFTDDSFDQDDCGYIILRMDGILVPFFIADLRYRSQDSVLLRLDGIDSEPRARELTGKEVFFPLKYRLDQEPDEDGQPSSLVGFTAEDLHEGILGKVTYVDESTINTLLVIQRYGKELLVPLNEVFIKEVRPDEMTIVLDLPPGLLDLDMAPSDEDS